MTQWEYQVEPPEMLFAPPSLPTLSPFLSLFPLVSCTPFPTTTSRASARAIPVQRLLVRELVGSGTRHRGTHRSSRVREFLSMFLTRVHVQSRPRLVRGPNLSSRVRCLHVTGRASRIYRHLARLQPPWRLVYPSSPCPCEKTRVVRPHAGLCSCAEQKTRKRVRVERRCLRRADGPRTGAR